MVRFPSSESRSVFLLWAQPDQIHNGVKMKQFKREEWIKDLAKLEKIEEDAKECLRNLDRNGAEAKCREGTEFIAKLKAKYITEKVTFTWLNHINVKTVDSYLLAEKTKSVDYGNKMFALAKNVGEKHLHLIVLLIINVAIFQQEKWLNSHDWTLRTMRKNTSSGFYNKSS
jgi:hypothetical protein